MAFFQFNKEKKTKIFFLRLAFCVALERPRVVCEGEEQANRMKEEEEEKEKIPNRENVLTDLIFMTKTTDDELHHTNRNVFVNDYACLIDSN